MRERRFKNLLKSGNVRITPAYAGKTYKHRYSEVNPEDHPRVCGKDKNGA